jgi:hypothetical protein
MASSYVNDLRLNEMATGDASGTWGDTTNVNLELIAEAFSYGTEAITTNADTHATVIADGATDPGRSMYLKYTGTLDSACTITISPNTVSKLWFIENATTGSQNIIISQGSGANITIPPADTKVVYSDGAGSGAAVVDAFASLSVVDLKVQDDLTVTDDLIVNGDIDLEGSIDVNGTANLDVVDIDGAVNMATTALVTGVLTTTATQVATGGITSGSDIISDTDSTDSLGSTGVRWLKGWFDSLTAGTLTVGSGSVTDSSGAISFGDENLTTTGIVTAAGTSVFTNLDISGDVDVDGTLETDNLTVGGAQGTDGQVLTSTGSGVAWEDASGGTTINNNADNRIITGSGTADTLEGESTLTYTTGALSVTGSGDTSISLNTGNDSGDNSIINFGDTADAVVGFIHYDHDTNKMQFSANSVYAGTAYPQLEVGNSSNTTSTAILQVTNYGNIGVGRTPQYYGSNRYFDMLAGAGGAMVLQLIGNNGSQKMNIVASTTDTSIINETNTELKFGVNQTAYFTINTSGVMSGDFNDTSDRNLKE